MENIFGKNNTKRSIFSNIMWVNFNKFGIIVPHIVSWSIKENLDGYIEMENIQSLPGPSCFTIIILKNAIQLV